VTIKDCLRIDRTAFGFKCVAAGEYLYSQIIVLMFASFDLLLGISLFSPGVLVYASGAAASASEGIFSHEFILVGSH
jgi:hypothetical protein